MEATGQSFSDDFRKVANIDQYRYLFAKEPPTIGNKQMLLTYAEWLLIFGFAGQRKFLYELYHVFQEKDFEALRFL